MEESLSKLYLGMLPGEVHWSERKGPENSRPGVGMNKIYRGGLRGGACSVKQHFIGNLSGVVVMSGVRCISLRAVSSAPREGGECCGNVGCRLHQPPWRGFRLILWALPRTCWPYISTSLV